MFRCVPLILLASCFYVTADERKARFDLDGDGVPLTDDCDPDNGSVGRITWYADIDGDGFGDPGNTVVQCDPPDGYVAEAGDCDDGAALVSPDAVEVCNGVDDDCNGTADDGADIPSWFEDNDGDGQGDPSLQTHACERPPGTVANGGDCDDSDPNVSAEAPEVACNGIDDDCDALVDLADPDVDPAEWIWYFDGDGDTYGTDDTTEVACTPSSGFVADGGDCEDGDPLIHPGVYPEECNGIDDNCDGNIDPYGSIGSTRYYYDLDGDGFGDGANPVDACVQPDDAVTNSGDCDDTDACVNVLAPEVCGNGVNDNCDLETDEAACVTPDTGTPPGGQCY